MERKTVSPQQPERELTSDQIAVVLTDFSKFSRKAFAVYEKHEGKSVFQPGDNQPRRRDSLIYYPNGLVWFGEGEGAEETPIGSPADYLEVINDAVKLTDFVGRTLDRGRIFRGVGGHASTEGETNPADYISWLHRHSENADFRRTLEGIVVDLLKGELDREFAPYDYEAGMHKAVKDFQRFDGDIEKYGQSVMTRDLQDALWRADLDYPDTPKDIEFKRYFEEEMGKTVRPRTLEEYLDSRIGSAVVDAEVRARITQDYELEKDRGVVHFPETSPEFKEAFQQRYLDKKARGDAVRKFTPQFNRLIGLLDVVRTEGKPDNRFAEAYEVLKQRAQEGFFKDALIEGGNIYNHLLLALNTVQQGADLRDFWLNNIAKDSNLSRVITYVHGLLTGYDTREQKRQQIPAILEQLQKRGYDVDRTLFYGVNALIFDENLLAKIFDHITNLCFRRGMFYHLNKDQTALDFLQNRNVGNGQFDFRFTRCTPEGENEMTVHYDLEEDRVTGDSKLDQSVRAYFERGYELPNDVWVTSLEGRKIEGQDTKIIDAEDQNLTGSYEGVIGLNSSHFPFVYNPETGQVLLSEPLKTRLVLFSSGGSWEEGRLGLDTIKNRVPHTQFTTIGETAHAVHELANRKRTERHLGDSIYDLDGKLSDETALHLATVIRIRLVKFQDGLTQ